MKKALPLLKTVVSWFCIYLIGFTLLLLVNFLAFLWIFNANNVKNILSSTNTYEKIVPAALAEAKGQIVTRGGHLPINEGWVLAAANRAFPAETLEQKTGTLIDAMFVWLNSDRSQPEFAIDFSENKQKFADEIGNSVASRLAQLPRCSNIPQEVDVYSIDCLPFGVSPGGAGREISSQISQSSEFLADPVFTPDELSFGVEIATGEDPYKQLDGLRLLLQNKNSILLGLISAMVAFAVVGFWGAKNRSKAVNRLIRAFCFAGLGILAIYGLISLMIRPALEGSNTDFAGRLLEPAAFRFLEQAQSIYLWSGLIILVVALGLYAAKKILALRLKKK